MFVEEVGDLQPIDEGGSGNILVTVVHQGCLVLKVVDVFFRLSLDFILTVRRWLLFL